MREIKFRAWHKTLKLMKELKCIEFDSCVWSKDGQWFVPISEVEIMQYTGLRDKNRREIYEGDIVQTETKELFTVVWGMDGAIWLRSVKKYDGEHFARRLGDFKHYVYVVGNIHENPELLSATLTLRNC